MVKKSQKKNGMIFITKGNKNIKKIKKNKIS